jgi:hypothetical protein
MPLLEWRPLGVVRLSLVLRTVVLQSVPMLLQALQRACLTVFQAVLQLPIRPGPFLVQTSTTTRCSISVSVHT